MIETGTGIWLKDVGCGMWLYLVPSPCLWLVPLNSFFLSCHEVSSSPLLCLSAVTFSPFQRLKSNGANRPWTETSEVKSQHKPFFLYLITVVKIWLIQSYSASGLQKYTLLFVLPFDLYVLCCYFLVVLIFFFQLIFLASENNNSLSLII